MGIPRKQSRHVVFRPMSATILILLLPISIGWMVWSIFKRAIFPNCDISACMAFHETLQGDQN